MGQERVKTTNANGIRFPIRISDAFKTRYGPKIKTVDAALYKFNEKLLYLFKDNLVSYFFRQFSLFREVFNKYLYIEILKYISI